MHAGKLRLHFFVTKQRDGSDSSNGQLKRIRKEDLREALQALSPEPASGTPKVFLCGPPSMLDEISDQLSQLEVNRDDIKIEKWW